MLIIITTFSLFRTLNSVTKLYFVNKSDILRIRNAKAMLCIRVHGRKLEERILKWSENHSVMSDSLQPHGLYGPWNSPGQNTGLSNPGIERRSPSLQVGSLPAQLPGNPEDAKGWGKKIRNAIIIKCCWFLSW